MTLNVTKVVISFLIKYLFAGGWSYLTAAVRAILELAVGSIVSSGTSTFCQRQEDVIVLCGCSETSSSIFTTAVFVKSGFDLSYLRVAFVTVRCVTCVCNRADLDGVYGV